MNNTDNTEILYKEIELIQSCINRMAQNSFMVKGWLITLLSVALALLPEKVDIKLLCIIGFVIIVCFWYLDAFYLKLERLYRWKYDWVIKNRRSSDKYIFDLNPHNSEMWEHPNGNDTKKTEPHIIKVMFTKTLIPLYALLLLLVIMIFVMSYLGCLHFVGCNI